MVVKDEPNPLLQEGKTEEKNDPNVLNGVRLPIYTFPTWGKIFYIKIPILIAMNIILYCLFMHIRQQCNQIYKLL
jgi:hypothetical protein